MLTVTADAVAIADYIEAIHASRLTVLMRPGSATSCAAIIWWCWGFSLDCLIRPCRDGLNNQIEAEATKYRAIRWAFLSQSRCDLRVDRRRANRLTSLN